MGVSFDDLDAIDRSALELAAVCSLVVPDLVIDSSRPAGTGRCPDAVGRLNSLADRGLLWRQRMPSTTDPVFLITAAGLQVAGRDLSVPVLDLTAVPHLIDVGFLYLAARDDAFGKLASFQTARETEAAGERIFADLLLTTPAGHRATVTLTRRLPSRQALEQALRAHAGPLRITRSLFLVEDRSQGEAIREITRELGVEDLVGLQLVEPA